jgi:hypothetical protein
MVSEPIEPIEGTRVRFPPGRVAIRLDERHRRAYRALYARYGTILLDMPVLRERDFGGRPVKVTPRQLDALNNAFASLQEAGEPAAGDAFEAQERGRTRLFKRLQHLS